jgi:hypothetical protein
MHGRCPFTTIGKVADRTTANSLVALTFCLPNQPSLRPSAGLERGWGSRAQEGQTPGQMSARHDARGRQSLPRLEREPVQGMNRTRNAELPGVRRARMGPPIAAPGSVLPRMCRGPVPNRCAQSQRSVTTARLRPASRAAGWVGVCPRMTAHRLWLSTTSRDGVAHEAPLSTVWRVFQSAHICEPHASTRARFPLGAPLAR